MKHKLAKYSDYAIAFVSTSQYSFKQRHTPSPSLNNFIFSESQAIILPLRLLARQLCTPQRPNHLGPRTSLALDLVCPTHLAARPLIFLEMKENK
jgi:hypothetical protein